MNECNRMINLCDDASLKRERESLLVCMRTSML